MVGLVNILIGFATIIAIFIILYLTGRLSGKWSTDRDKWDEEDYLGKGFAIWLLIGIFSVACFMVGELIMHFV